MNTYLVFVIQGYQKEEPDGRLSDVAELQLIDTTLSNALKRAKKISGKKFYRLSLVIEKEVQWPSPQV